MADRQERERHYHRQAERASAEQAMHAARSTRYSRLRLALFLVALALLLVGTLGRAAMSWPLVMGALAGFAGFAVAVGAHARVEDARARRRAARVRRDRPRAHGARLGRRAGG